MRLIAIMKYCEINVLLSLWCLVGLQLILLVCVGLRDDDARSRPFQTVEIYTVTSAPNRLPSALPLISHGIQNHRFMQILNMSEPMESPYSFSLSQIEKNSHPVLEKAFNTSSEIAAFVKSAFRNIFVRNPFSRMLSAYVDKVFAPNPVFWRLWGNTAITAFRKTSGKRLEQCGHNVTFAELMSYADRLLRKTDIHFISVASLCNPCEYHYNFVGKMETFSEDIVLLARTLKLPLVTYFESQQFRLDYAKDAIEDSINSPFSWMEYILRCISKHEAGLRIWRKLQIRGIISRRIIFPYSEEEFKHVTAEQFINAAVDAHKKSTDKDELKQQKRDAFLEAYSTVDVTTLPLLMESLKEDFEMFGYDIIPADVFGINSRSITRGAFDWKNEWKK